MRDSGVGAALVALALLLAPAPAGAQSLTRRVEAAGDGTVRMRFASDPDVCGNASGDVQRRDAAGEHDNTIVWYRRRYVGDDRRGGCVRGPVRVELRLHRGVLDDLDLRVGAELPEPASDGRAAVVDLGEVDPREAADLLLRLARDGAGGPAARSAMLAAVLADAAPVAAGLTAILDDDGAAASARREAAFWLGESGEAAALPALSRAARSANSSGVRRAAIFGLSRSADPRAFDLLTDLASHDADRDVRRAAIFWIGQSHDPRALPFLTDLILR